MEEENLSQKHSAMISRLENLHQSRLQQQAISRSNNNSSDSTSSLESTKSFLQNFTTSKNTIQSQLNHVTDPNTKPYLDNISLSITNLEKMVAENSYYLPNYEIRSSLKTISDLRAKLEIANAELLPKKKFSFKNKSTTKNVVQEKMLLENVVEEKIRVRETEGFKDKEGVLLVKSFGDLEEEGGGEFSLSNLISCEIRITGKCRAVFIHKLKSCRVFIGPIMGSIHIEQVEDCLFMLASHQIRIHFAKKCDFYLRVRSRPIIEDSNGVRFGPYLLDYDGIEKHLKECSLDEDTGNWENVDDFRWLRAVQSPNWCVIPEEECVGVVNISGLETPAVKRVGEF